MVTTMRTFNLEEAKAGKPVCTRDGDKARIVCFDVHGRAPPLFALITDPDGDEYVSYHRSDGTSTNSTEEDLFMDAVKHKGWATVYKHNNGLVVIGSWMYSSQEEADHDSCPVGRLAIVPIEWEE